MVTAKIVERPAPSLTPGGPLSSHPLGDQECRSNCCRGNVLRADGICVGGRPNGRVPVTDLARRLRWLASYRGFWIVVVAVGSFALGGYLAGRVRSTWSASADEVEFRDGMHGLIAWALGRIMLGAALLALTASTFAAGNAAVPPRDTAARQASSPTRSIADSARNGVLSPLLPKRALKPAAS